MTAVYVLAPAALADLRNIAVYTRRNWGRKQAHIYRDQLELCFEALASGQLRSKKLSDVRSGLVMVRCQHHYVFARLRDNQPLSIEAVLHEKMDLMARIAERLG